MEGVVLVHKPSVSLVSAHLADPWELAAGIQEEKKPEPLNHYHLWNHSETAGNG